MAPAEELNGKDEYTSVLIFFSENGSCQYVQNLCAICVQKRNNTFTNVIKGLSGINGITIAFLCFSKDKTIILELKPNNTKNY